MNAVSAKSSAAAMPSTCIWVVTGFDPMSGRRKPDIDQRVACAVAAFFAAGGLAFVLGPPGRVAGPAPAATLVRVDERMALAGRAAVLGLPPEARRNQSPIEDL